MDLKEKIKKIRFRLCFEHNNCANRVFNFKLPLCDRNCVMQDFKSSVNAYNVINKQKWNYT